MSTRNLWLTVAHPFILLYIYLFPHRYAKKGSTRVQYDFSHRADDLFYLQDEHDYRQHGTGTIEDIGYVYKTPGFGHKIKPGVYSSGNNVFPESFIVKDDATGKLLTMERESLHFTAKYGIGIPIFHRKKIDERFVRDFDIPLKAYPGDCIRLEKSSLDHCFLIEHVVFTSLGSPRYNIRYSKDMLLEMRLDVERMSAVEQEKYRSILKGFLCDSDFQIVSRGNMYHLHNDGHYRDFVFEDLDAEVNFWSHQCGEWLADTKNAKMYDINHALSAIESEEIDMAVELLDDYSPIKILPYFAAFREQARKASLRQLRKHCDTDS